MGREGQIGLNARTLSWYLESWKIGWCEEKTCTLGIRSVGSKNSSHWDQLFQSSGLSRF